MLADRRYCYLLTISDAVSRYLLASGFYGNSTEVIRDAIRRMQADEERATAFRRAVAEGEAQLDRGAGRDYGSKRLDEVAETARKNLRSGKPIDSDVLP